MEVLRGYVDTIALRQPAPTVAEIFAGMKMLEERQNARDKAEHGEANYAGKAAGGHRGVVGGVNQRQPRPKPKLPALVKVQGHLLSICKRSKDAASAARGARGFGGGGGY